MIYGIRTLKGSLSEKGRYKVYIHSVASFLYLKEIQAFLSNRYLSLPVI